MKTNYRRIQELKEEIWEAFQRIGQPQYCLEDFEVNNKRQEAIIADCERELKALQREALEKEVIAKQAKV